MALGIGMAVCADLHSSIAVSCAQQLPVLPMQGLGPMATQKARVIGQHVHIALAHFPIPAGIASRSVLSGWSRMLAATLGLTVRAPDYRLQSHRGASLPTAAKQRKSNDPTLFVPVSRALLCPIGVPGSVATTVATPSDHW